MNEYKDTEWHQLLPPFMWRAPLDPSTIHKLTYSFYGKQLEIIWFAVSTTPSCRFEQSAS